MSRYFFGSAHQVSWKRAPQCFPNSASHLPIGALELPPFELHVQLHVSAGESGTHVCTANALPTEPSPHCELVFIVVYLLSVEGPTKPFI